MFTDPSPISVGDLDAIAKKEKARQYSAAYRAKKKEVRVEPTQEELVAKYKAQRAKSAEYQRKRRANLSPEAMEGERNAMRAYANARYAKMRAAYLASLATDKDSIL